MMRTPESASPSVLMVKTVSPLVGLIAGFLMYVPSALSCPSISTSVYSDGWYVYATGTTIAGPEDYLVQAETTLTNPAGLPSRFSYGASGYHPDSASVSVSLVISPDDGTFNATTYHSGQTQAGGTYPLGQTSANQTAPPWVQLVRTSMSPTSIGQQDGTASFVVVVLTSPNCSGSVTVSTGLTAVPSSIKAYLNSPAPDGDGANHALPNATALATATMSGGMTHNFSSGSGYVIKTAMDNSDPGSITASGSFYSWPTACTAKDPDPASGSKTATVNVQ